jgi:Asp-tRNA(Asn)/Glu-tRNA(Gln) amidotransferase A subunit family amidase
VGVQVIARFGDDAGALKAARFVEEALVRFS